MDLPFSADEFFAFFARYNEAIWPAQVVAYVLAGIVIVLPFFNVRHYNRIISGILALFWLWIGIVFLVIHYSALNGATAVASCSRVVHAYLATCWLFRCYGALSGWVQHLVWVYIRMR